MGVGLEDSNWRRRSRPGDYFRYLFFFLWKILFAHAAATAVVLLTRYYGSTQERKGGVKAKKWISDSAGHLFTFFFLPL